MRGDGAEDGGPGRLRRKAERETHAPVEVAAAERCVVAAGQALAFLAEAVVQRAKDARLADAGLADEDGSGSVRGCTHGE